MIINFIRYRLLGLGSGICLSQTCRGTRGKSAFSLYPETLLFSHLRSTVSSTAIALCIFEGMSIVVHTLAWSSEIAQRTVIFILQKMTGTVSKACMKCRKSSKSSCKRIYTKWGLLPWSWQRASFRCPMYNGGF